MFVYDITNYSSFEDIDDWVDAVNRVTEKDGHLKPRFALVGNKGRVRRCDLLRYLKNIVCYSVDLEHRRVVRKDRHNKYCKEHRMSRYMYHNDNLLLYALN